jgi:hypothetical protein
VAGLDHVEDVCEQQRTTLVVHPAIRRALRGYEESFSLGLRCFLSGETHLFYLPLQDGGHVRLAFSLRTSSGGHTILRVVPVSEDGLARVRASLPEQREPL